MKNLIYNQNDIPRDQLRYGLFSSARTGCGWIATYNAMELMGYHVEPEKLIRYFEKQVPVVNGFLGTAVWSPAACFRKWGFPTQVTTKRSEMNDLARNADVCILYYWWRDGVKMGAHFVALHHEDRGFVGYNTYKNSKGPDYYGENLEEFLEKRGYFGAVLTAIQKK